MIEHMMLTREEMEKVYPGKADELRSEHIAEMMEILENTQWEVPPMILVVAPEDFELAVGMFGNGVDIVSTADIYQPTHEEDLELYHDVILKEVLTYEKCSESPIIIGSNQPERSSWSRDETRRSFHSVSGNHRRMVQRATLYRHRGDRGRRG